VKKDIKIDRQKPMNCKDKSGTFLEHTASNARCTLCCWVVL